MGAGEQKNVPVYVKGLYKCWAVDGFCLQGSTGAVGIEVAKWLAVITKVASAVDTTRPCNSSGLVFLQEGYPDLRSTIGFQFFDLNVINIDCKTINKSRASDIAEQ